MNKHTKKRIVIVVSACVIVIFSLCIAIYLTTWTILPIKSSPHELTVVLYNGFNPNKPVITLSHYEDGVHIADYTLTIETGVHILEPQSYELPEIITGSLELNVKLKSNIYADFTITFDSAEELYENGLLIYLTDNDSEYAVVGGIGRYDRYVYFISGEDEMCYFRGRYASEWECITDAPAPKRLKREPPMPYVTNYCGWKENEWVVTYPEN